jgi:basic membrane protein A and related proteins
MCNQPWSGEIPKRDSLLKLLTISTVLTVIALITIGWINFEKSEAATSDALLKIGFITVGPASDHGYNYAHDQGRRFLQSALQGKVSTSIVENIPESAEVERVMEKMVANGTQLIFSTSYGYLDPALRVAARHPNVVIMQCGRTNPNTQKNLGTYWSRQFEPMYIGGMVAGRLTKTNEMGFIAAHPVPQVLSNINAFTLGATSVNPKVKVHVVWTNSWSDPASEAEAVKGLIEQHADVMTMHVDSPITIAQTAEKHGIYTVGYHADLRKYAPKGFLTGQEWDWGHLYINIAKSVQDHTWKRSDIVYPMKAGYTELANFGPAVPKALQLQALDLKHKIEGGKVSVFQGPLKDRDGKERLAAGKKADDQFIAQMNFFVPGVAGVLPNK